MKFRMRKSSGNRFGINFLSTWLIGLCFCIFLGFDVVAAPMSANHAQSAVAHWIAQDGRPIGARLGKSVRAAETSVDAAGLPVYHVVYLTEDGTSPAGFVIVSGDDEAEPIVAFGSGAHFDPSSDNPLGALVAADLPRRIALARNPNLSGAGFGLLSAGTKAKQKWGNLLAPAAASTTSLDGQSSSISDVRVAPLIKSKWDQDNVNGDYCYNYYTPNHYLSGCVATALGQLLYYFKYPETAVGVKSFTITVDGVSRTATTRGGNGSGGVYVWDSMTAIPASGITTVQRQAIGALLYDAGLSVRMQYSSSWSGAYTLETRDALVNTFYYSNAVKGYDFTTDDFNIGAGLIGMVNPNLDAGLPVLFGISKSDGTSGHAIVCDGYGYNSSTLYHHLNMGWSGDSDAWYALPVIDAGWITFGVIHSCIYNVFKTGSGEIISGRITDSSNNPVVGATVTATRSGGGTYTATTGSTGIYAVVKVPSNSTYTLSVSMPGYSFSSCVVAVGKSYLGTASGSLGATSGNVWGADFSGSGTSVVGNDNLANACVMTGESWVSIGNNTGMTVESNEPYFAGNKPQHTAWWQWTAPSNWPGNQTVTISTLGSSFDTLLDCVKGPGKVFSTQITLVGSNDNETGKLTSALSFTAVPGTLYRIGVDGKSGATGSIVLTLTGPATITTVASPAAGGVLSGAGTYAHGSSVTVKATANAGYVFTNWVQDGSVVSSSSSYTFTASVASNLIANFQPTPWTTWELGCFSATELLNSSISGPLGNPEGDGICNLLKYAFLLDRKHPDRTLLPKTTVENGYLTLTYVINKSATDLNYIAEVSTDMQNWNSGTGYISAPVVMSDNGSTQTLKVRDLTAVSSGKARFLRLRVTKP